MRFGVNMLNFGAGAGPEAIDAWAAMAEERGYSFLTISDHVAITKDVFAEYQTPFYDPLITLAYLASATSEVRLGTSVLVIPHRHPLLVARSVANIDQLSRGRAFLAVGAGWAQEEFDALGLDFAARGRVTDEYLDVIAAAWRAETISHDGERVRFADVHTGPLPAGGRQVPIWVGGESAAAVRRVIARGDVWHPLQPRVGWLEQVGMPLLRRAAEAAGRATPPVVPRVVLDLRDAELPDEERPVGRGGVAQVRADIRALEALGIEEVLFDTYDEKVEGAADDHGWHIRMYERFAEEVADPRTGDER